MSAPDTIAILINPKTRELVEVRRERLRSVTIFYPDTDEKLGEAYWDSSEVFEIEADEYARSHSPGSGVEVGKGFGVCLYAGLCLRVWSDTPKVGIASSDGGYGHSTRSSDADAFWNRCVDKGLAEATEVGTESEERSTTVDTSNFVEIDCEYTGDDECIEIENVEHRDLDVSYLAGGGEVEAQYMHADKVAEAGLILELLDMKAELESVPEPPPELLAGLNLSNCYDRELIERIIQRVHRAGLEPSYLERMLNTVPLEIYQQLSASKQLKMPFLANGRKYRRNAAVEQNLDELWDAYYGDLQDI